MASQLATKLWNISANRAGELVGGHAAFQASRAARQKSVFFNVLLSTATELTRADGIIERQAFRSGDRRQWP